MNTLPPTPPGEFLIGHLRQFRSHKLEFLMANALEYGDVVHYWFGPRHVYQLNHPDLIQYMLVKAPEKFHKSQMLKRTTRAAIGEGLLTSEGEFHRRQRKLVQPAFHHNRISNYAEVMVDYTTRMLDQWHDAAQHDLHHEMMKLTMQIVAKTLFDADLSSDADSLGHAITIGVETASQRITRPFYIPDWIPTPQNIRRRRAAELVERTITEIITDRRQSGEDKGDLLSMLLLAQDEDGDSMTDKQVRDEAMTLFIAGHETTANNLTWALYLLSQHPEVEKKLRAELDAVLAGRAPTMRDLPQLTYTNQIINEAMRIYPPAWVFTRQAVEDVNIGGYDIPANGVVMMSPYVIHRLPAYWDEPEQFRPERFAPGWEKDVPKYAFVPFGAGPRVCIGSQFAVMEANLVLATIMQRYQLSLLPGQRVEPEPLITLRPKGIIWVNVQEREHAAFSTT